MLKSLNWLHEPRRVRAVALSVCALDKAAPLQQIERRAHGHLVGRLTDVFGDFRDGHLYRAARAETAKRVVERRDDFARGIRALDEKFLRSHVGIVEKQLAPGRLAVPPCASGLLVVGLDAAWNVIVNDKSKIGAIDPHAEGIGRHRNVEFSAHKRRLGLGPFLIGHTAVIGDASNPLFA